MSETRGKRARTRPYMAPPVGTLDQAPMNAARGAVLAMVATADYFKQHGEMPR